LVSDDTAGIVWRVVAPGAAPTAAPKPVVAKSLPPSKHLIDPTKPMIEQLGDITNTTMPTN
jgi:hypothetical protein